MCDLCKSQDKDYKFRNGKRLELYTRALYNVFPGTLLKTKLCFVHDAELFLIGEARFAANYPDFIIWLKSRGGRSQERDLPFMQGSSSRNLHDLF